MTPIKAYFPWWVKIAWQYSSSNGFKLCNSAMWSCLKDDWKAGQHSAKCQIYGKDSEDEEVQLLVHERHLHKSFKKKNITNSKKKKLENMIIKNKKNEATLGQRYLLGPFLQVLHHLCLQASIAHHSKNPFCVAQLAALEWQASTKFILWTTTNII